MKNAAKFPMAIASLIVFTVALFSFKGKEENIGEKEKLKKYEIIHHHEGEVMHFDTLIPMNSDFSVDDFLALKNISNENVEVIKVPAGSGTCDFTSNKTMVMKIDSDDMEGELIEIMEYLDIESLGEDSESRMVKIICEEDEDGNLVKKKFVNGEEVEFTDEDMVFIHKGHHGEKEGCSTKSTIKITHTEDLDKLEAEELGELTEDHSVKIICTVDDDGNMVKKKYVNGEEVEFNEDEMEIIHELNDGELDHQIKVITKELKEIEDLDLDEMMEEIEIKLSDINLEELMEVEGVTEDMMKEVQEALENIDIDIDIDDEKVVVVNKVISDGEEEEKEMVIELLGDEMVFISDEEMENGKVDIRMHTGEGDFTMVLVTEGIDPTEKAMTKETVEAEGVENLSYFPNPSEGSFTLSFDQSEKAKTEIIITDVNGKKVYSERLGKFSGNYSKLIDLSEFGSGVYLININQGKKTTSKKIIIQ